MSSSTTTATPEHVQTQTISASEAQAAELAKLKQILGSPTHRAALIRNEELCSELLAAPHLAPTLEAAILAADQAEQSQQSSATAPTALDLALELEPGPAYTYRVQHYPTRTAGNIVRGRHKSPSVHTTAIEQVADDGTIHNRIMLGTTQAAMISALSPDELVKLAPRD